MVEEQTPHAALRARLHELPPDLRAQVEALLAENQRLREEVATLRARLDARGTSRRERTPTLDRTAAVPKPKYPETTTLVVLSALGRGKRTPINAYTPQHRGGVGVFDIKLPEEDTPAHLLVAGEGATIFCLSDRGRAFRVPVNAIPLTDIRAAGAPLSPHLNLAPGERITAATVMDPDTPWTHLFIITEHGWVKRLRHNYVGPRLGPGTALHDPRREGGAPRVLFVGTEEKDLFIVTHRGIGIRFPVVAAPGRGARGIMLQRDDYVVGAAQVDDSSTVLMVTASGQGTRREMSGFAANRSPGGKGKIAMRADDVIAIAVADEGDEAFCITRFAKILRFPVAEVPVRQNPVRGVEVMNVRGDTVAALVVSTPPQIA